MDGEGFGRRWSTWGHMNENSRCQRMGKGEVEKEVVVDLVEDWHDAWWRRESASSLEDVG